MKFKHTDTSYYMHICGLEAFLFTLKMKKYTRNMIKESSPKSFKMLKIVWLRGGGGGGGSPSESGSEPPTRALPWTHKGLKPPCPLAKIGVPQKAMSESGPVPHGDLHMSVVPKPKR